MPEGQPAPQSTEAPPRPPKWRVPLLLIVLCSVVFALFWVSGRVKRPGRWASVCFNAMMAHRFDQALEALERYRELAREDIPASVEDELFQLRNNPDYPLGSERANAYFMARTIFLCVASGHAMARAEDEPGAAVAALRYVFRNVQSGGGPPKAQRFHVGPAHALYRGYGGPVHSAWAMAELLRHRRGLNACVVQIPAADKDAEPYYLCGSVIHGKMYLFDPYRAVAICRGHGTRVADVAGLLSGRHKLAPRFGGPGTPVTLDGLRKATYWIPASVATVTADAYLIQQIFEQSERKTDLVYRSFRRDLEHVAAAVYGHGTEVRDSFIRTSVDGRSDAVALWPVPFKVDQMRSSEEYAGWLGEVHRAVIIYWGPREDQLLGQHEAALTRYEEILAKHADDPEVAGDVSFFRACSGLRMAERSDLLRAYLREHPNGRWRPLATLRLAELEVWQEHKAAALELVAQMKAPYDLYAALLAKALEQGERNVRWVFPEPEDAKGKEDASAGEE